MKKETKFSIQNYKHSKYDFQLSFLIFFLIDMINIIIIKNNIKIKSNISFYILLHSFHLTYRKNNTNEFYIILLSSLEEVYMVKKYTKSRFQTKFQNFFSYDNKNCLSIFFLTIRDYANSIEFLKNLSKNYQIKIITNFFFYDLYLLKKTSTLSEFFKFFLFSRRNYKYFFQQHVFFLRNVSWTLKFFFNIKQNFNLIFQFSFKSGNFLKLASAFECFQFKKYITIIPFEYNKCLVKTYLKQIEHFEYISLDFNLTTNSILKKIKIFNSNKTAILIIWSKNFNFITKVLRRIDLREIGFISFFQTHKIKFFCLNYVKKKCRCKWKLYKNLSCKNKKNYEVKIDL
nr:hypothetical protein CparaKRNrm2_p050 [Cryptomonas paramecium]